MMIRARKNITVRFFGGLLGAGVAFGAMSALAAAEKLPPCEPDKPIPAGGCMAPKDPVTPLDRLRPAPPLNVPSGVAPPLVPAPVPAPEPPGAPGAIVPALPPAVDTPVIKPPPTGDSEIVKPPPQADSKMPVIKPPKTPEPKT